MNQEYIDSLYLKAFEVIKKTFGKPTALIEWASNLSNAIHEHSRHFKYMDKDRDGDMDIHLDVTFASSIGIGWLENDSDAILHALSAFREDFNKVYQSALSAFAWRNALYSTPDYDFLDIFKKLSALYPIFKEVDKAWEVIRDNWRKNLNISNI